jgi:hypothetical protein
MTSTKHKLPWSKSKFPPDKIARFLLEASKGNLNSEWKAFGKLFNQLVTARSIELESIDQPINNFVSHLCNDDAEHNKVYLSALFTTLRIKSLSPRFTLSDLRTYVEELIDELNREQLTRQKHESNVSVLPPAGIPPVALYERSHPLRLTNDGGRDEGELGRANQATRAQWHEANGVLPSAWGRPE